jgi:pyruvate dehydrogenase E1 component
MPDFWQFPTVSMGLGPIMSIYNARFLRYLENRGLAKTDGRRVWAFLGDGECDEPETLGALTIAAREKLDNLTFVINCNLQRLDGPVRGNGKIIQELESLFRGAGWNVIKVVWGSNWDPLLARDRDGLLVRRMEEVVDGEYQKYAVEGGAYIREHFFGKYPELLKMVEHMSDEELANLKRGGHDPLKVYSAYKAASEFKGAPTVVIDKTVKGYGMGEAAEGLNISHQQKKLKSNHLLEFRNRFGLPLGDEEATKAAFLRPDISTPEMAYLHERRKALGGPIPARRPVPSNLAVPGDDFIARYAKGSGDKTPSTTGIFVDMLGFFLKTPNLGKNIVPIVPDEARTFGMDPFFTSYKIYSPLGQLYDPVDSRMAIAYRESKSGQLLEEGINESGSMSSFIAAGSSHASNGVPMIPFYIYYSMFGFQRVGDLIWAASDTRVRGFLLGATSGRTTLNGEGLQHEDGHSQLMASTVPSIQAYDPAYAHELGVILRDGIKRMYGGGNEDIIYYISLYNDNYPQVPMPEGCEEGILRGLYKLTPSKESSTLPKVHIFGSGPILVYALTAQKILAEFGVSADVWSATSYKRLRLEALEAERFNLLHPLETPKKSYLEEVLSKEDDDSIYLAVSDNMRQVSEMISRWVPGGLYALGTDGFGRSETRASLRRHFEVDAEFITLGVLSQLMRRGKISPQVVADYIKKSGINPEKICPLTA